MPFFEIVDSPAPTGPFWCASCYQLPAASRRNICLAQVLSGRAAPRPFRPTSKNRARIDAALLTPVRIPPSPPGPVSKLNQEPRQRNLLLPARSSVCCQSAVKHHPSSYRTGRTQQSPSRSLCRQFALLLRTVAASHAPFAPSHSPPWLRQRQRTPLMRFSF